MVSPWCRPDLRRERAGPDDLGRFRLSLQVHHAPPEQGRLPPAEERQRAGGGLLHGGDRELGVRLPMLVHGPALLPQPL